MRSHKWESNFLWLSMLTTDCLISFYIYRTFCYIVHFDSPFIFMHFNEYELFAKPDEKIWNKKNRKLQELIMFLVFCLVVWVYLTKLFYITLSDKGKWQKSAHKMKNSGQWSDRVDCKLYCNRVVEIWFVSRIILLLHPEQWNMQQHSSYAFILRLKL